MNKISITIRSKIDGSIVFDSNKEEYQKAIPAGIPVMDVIDDSLDSFTFTVKDILQRKPFQPFDLVTFTITDGESTDEFQYFVLNDNAKTYRNLDNDARGYPRSSYEHTIACVETTKYLEKIKVFELTMTNKHDTFLAQFEKAMNNIEPPVGVGYGGTVTGIGSRFSMTKALANLLENVEGCDFSFQNTDARTIFDEMLARVNSRVVVHNVDFDAYGRYTITLGSHLLDVATDVTPVWELGGHGQIVHEEMGSDAQDYAGTIVARGYNSIPDEPLTVRVRPSSSNETLSSATGALILPYPISSKGIKSVKAECTVKYYERQNGSLIGPKYLRGLMDLSKYFVVQEEFDLLPEEYKGVDDEGFVEASKHSRVPYMIGEKKLSLQNSITNMYGMQCDVLQNILSWAREDYIKQLHKSFCKNENANDCLGEGSCVFDTGTSFVLPYADNWGLASISDLPEAVGYTYQIEYYPLLDTVASIQKTDETNLSLMAVMDSQTEQTLDISRHGKKLAGLLKRVGNDSYVVDVKAQKYSGLLSLLSRIDVDGEKYVLYKREYAVYNDFVNCRYYFSQNYTAVQKNAGVNRERQIFPIPTEYNETPILIKKKLEFNLNFAWDDGTCTAFSTDLVKSAMQTLIGKYDTGSLRWMSFCSVNITEEFSTNRYLLPLVSYSMDNTMFFMASPLDNYSVAFSPEPYAFSIWGDAGYKTAYNPYVIIDNNDCMGEASRFRLWYAFDFETLTTVMARGEDNEIINANAEYNLFNCKALLPDGYPVLPADNKLKTAMSKDENGEGYFAIDYKKDRMQKPSFVLSLSVAVAEKDKGKLFVNPIFAKMNNLVRDNDDGVDMHFWIKDTPFVEGDEFVDTKYIAKKNDGSRFEAGDYFEIVDRTTYVKLDPLDEDYEQTFGTYQSWGICDASGRVYLAVNGEVCQIALACRD